MIQHIILSFYILHVTSYSDNFRLGHSRGGNLGLPPCEYCDKLPPERWFYQKLDQFSPTENRLWKQRYFVNDSFYDYDNPGPIFLMIGGEGPADPRWAVEGAWIKYAKQFNALCILLEHRYYGLSQPTEDRSVKNLKYLSSQQALQDLAFFISQMNNQLKLNKKVKWIAFGGSYSGSLAAWLRYKYPHLVEGAVSSSAPLEAKLDFKEYYQVVVNALKEKTGDAKCVLEIKDGIQVIKNLMITDRKRVEKDFRVCTSFKDASSNDIRNFYNSVANNFADLVQYNEDNRISANEKYRNVTINSVCKIFDSEGYDSAYKNLAAFNSLMLEESNQTCLDYNYGNLINSYKNITWSSDAARQWMYQTCTEFGFFQTSSGERDVFGDDFPIDFFAQQCQDIFGAKFNKSFLAGCVEKTNDNYGGLDLVVSQVVFVHGSVDPWHSLGITSTKENDSPAIYIKGTAHCANEYPPRENDPPELKKARLDIVQYISTWLDKP